MNQEAITSQSEFLAEFYKRDLKWVLEKSLVENLESVEASLVYCEKWDLRRMVKQVLQEIKDLENSYSNEVFWHNIKTRLWADINHFQQTMMQHFLAYNILHSLFVSEFSPLDIEYREKLLKKHDLTPAKLRNLLSEFIGDRLFLEEVRHGGSVQKINDADKLRLLALYNRYLIVIKNARAEAKALRKQKQTETTAKRNSLAKYEIPDDLMLSAFSSDSPGDVALQWAKDTLQTDLSYDYLKKVLNATRRQYKNTGFIIDVDYERGRRIYGFNRRDKTKALLLKYTPVVKIEDENFDDLNSFLIEMSY